MVRTTLELEDEMYRKLVEESVRRYGSTKKISKILNEKLKLSENVKMIEKIKLPEISIGKKIDWRFVEKSTESIEESWKE